MLSTGEKEKDKNLAVMTGCWQLLWKRTGLIGQLCKNIVEKFAGNIKKHQRDDIDLKN